MQSIIDISHKNFQEDHTNSRRFSEFPGVVDTLWLNASFLVAYWEIYTVGPSGGLWHWRPNSICFISCICANQVRNVKHGENIGRHAQIVLWLVKLGMIDVLLM